MNILTRLYQELDIDSKQNAKYLALVVIITAVFESFLVFSIGIFVDQIINSTQLNVYEYSLYFISIVI
ncbi:MAG: hypothetical protein VW124_19790, partial [Paracoccaceae bacterium]